MFDKVDGAWKRTTKLTLDKAQRGKRDLFGYDVAIAGDVIAVGSLEEKGGPKEAGAAYVFERTGGAWAPAAKLVSSDRQPRDGFGNHVAVLGELIVVSAPTNTGEPGAGAIYTFRRDAGGYAQADRIAPRDAQAYDYFGDGLAARAPFLVVSANGARRAYIYEASADGLVRRETLEGRSGFGFAVAASSTHVAVTELSDSKSTIRTYAFTPR